MIYLSTAMKMMENSNSLGALLPIRPTSEEKSGGSGSSHGRSFHSTLDGFDEDDYSEEGGRIQEKKRRLTVDQVKALEKNFELENKLEPERKVKLAQELGLQPRQVAVWFQNRRARWKTKQLERDYSTLKAEYETLKASYESLQKEKESLVEEVRGLTAKQEAGIVTRDSADSQQEENEMIGVAEVRATEQSNTNRNIMLVNESAEINNSIDQKPSIVTSPHSAAIFNDIKDGSDDSDSSAILNDDNSPHRSTVAAELFPQQFNQPSKFNFSVAPSPSPPSPFSSSLSSHKTFHQFLRMEEHNFLNSEESCNFFNYEQPPTMPWYYDQWT